jgi:hypothetical protein
MALTLKSGTMVTIMTLFETIQENINPVENQQDIERLNRSVGVLAMQAFGRSRNLSEQYNPEPTEVEDDGETIIRSYD